MVNQNLLRYIPSDMSKTITTTGTAPLPPEARRVLSDRIAASSAHGLSRVTGIDRFTLARAASGARLRACTRRVLLELVAAPKGAK